MTGSLPVLVAAAEPDAADCSGSGLCEQLDECIRTPVPLLGSVTDAGRGAR